MTLTWNKGDVKVVAGDGATRDAYSGNTLAAGDVLKTGKTGKVELNMQSGGTVRVEPDSELKLPEKKTDAPQQSLELLKGKLFISVEAAALKAKGKQEFRIKTPATILAVKGTKFFAMTSDTQDTIGVHQGEVSVFGLVSKQTQMARTGTVVEVSSRSVPAPRKFTTAEEAQEAMYPISETALDIAPSATFSTWSTDFVGAMEKAKARKKLILLYFCSSTAMGKASTRAVITAEPAFKKYARENFILVAFDFQGAKVPNKLADLSKQMMKQFSPDGGGEQLVIIDTHGEVVGKTGNVSENGDKLVADLKAIVEKAK